MKSKPGFKRVGVRTLLLGACAAVVSFNAQAGCNLLEPLVCDPWAHFTSGGLPVRSVFCDTPEIRGDFGVNESRYASRGICVQLEGKTPVADDRVAGRSEFDDYSQGREIFRAGWTAEAGYNATTKEAWEKITFPAPTVDKPAPGGQPYGRFESKMICAVDPWLEFGAARCAPVNRSATGSLGDIEKMLRLLSMPFTAKSANAQALYVARQAFLKRSAALAAVAHPATQAKEALRSVTLPEIVEPRAGGAYPPQTPLKIRVLAPRNLKVETYEVQFESQQNNGGWQAVTNVRVAAAEIEGPLGYTGWGWHQRGTGPLTTASTGRYRLRARTTSPSAGEAGAWREFTIAGQPALGPDVLHPSLGSASATTRAPLPAGATAPAQVLRAASSAGTGATAPPALDWNKAAPGGVNSQPTPRITP